QAPSSARGRGTPAVSLLSGKHYRGPPEWCTALPVTIFLCNLRQFLDTSGFPLARYYIFLRLKDVKQHGPASPATLPARCDGMRNPPPGAHRAGGANAGQARRDHAETALESASATR